MYARVVTWEGGDADAMRASAAEINSQAAEGPPEGLDAVGLMILIDGENGSTLGVSLFETEQAMRDGDVILNAMSPPGGGMGTRSGVGFYEVAADIRM